MAIGDIVLDRHKLLFAAVAREPPIGLGLWILVRGTNKESLEYLSRDDYKTRYTPKPIDCKAKTARKGPCAGLVINPHNVQNAFDGDDLNKAIKLWDDLHEKGNPLVFSERKDRYSEETSGPLKGCIKLDGKYIHGDYDLKAIILPGHESATIALLTDLHGVSNVRHGPQFYEVQRRINASIGADMVQHGAEDEYKGHSDDSIFVFGPKGEYDELRGMAQVQSWYNKFRRNTLDANFLGGVPADKKPGIRGIVQPDGSIRPVSLRKP
jgi:hypothetical protein